MATKAELRTEIENHGWEIYSEEKNYERGGIESWTIYGKKLVDGVMRMETVQYAYDTENNAAYWLNQNPFPGTDFRDAVNSKIEAEISAGTIVSGFIVFIDMERKQAKVEATKEVSGDLQVAEYLVEENAQGGLDIRPIVG